MDTYPKPLAESYQYQWGRLNSPELNISLQQVVIRITRLESRSPQYFDMRSPCFSHNNNCYIYDFPNHCMRDCPHKYQTQGPRNQRRLKLVRTIMYRKATNRCLSRLRVSWVNGLLWTLKQGEATQENFAVNEAIYFIYVLKLIIV